MSYCERTGKIQYASRAEARGVLTEMKRTPHGRARHSRNVSRLIVFKCGACDWFHIGNDNTRPKHRRLSHGFQCR